MIAVVPNKWRHVWCLL